MTATSVWYTSEDGQRYRLSRQPDLEFVPGVANRDARGARERDIHVDPSFAYQSILDIGSSQEEASVYHLSHMSQTIDPEGTVALVVVNQTRREQRFAITLGSARAETPLPDRTLATYTWSTDRARAAGRAQAG